jgi:hypothetical protein
MPPLLAAPSIGASISRQRRSTAMSLNFRPPISTDKFTPVAPVVDDVVFNFSVVCQCLARQLKEHSPN